jgi:hypothetical protein
VCGNRHGEHSLLLDQSRSPCREAHRPRGAGRTRYNTRRRPLARDPAILIDSP